MPSGSGIVLLTLASAQFLMILDAFPTGQGGRERLHVGDLVTVLTVDDQNYFRGVMREVIESTDGFELVGEAASGEAALEAAEALSPGLVIMDKRMPGMGGIEASRLLIERDPEIVVVITSIEEPDEDAMKSCLRAAFLQKQHLTPRRLRELWLHRRPR